MWGTLTRRGSRDRNSWSDSKGVLGLALAAGGLVVLVVVIVDAGGELGLKLVHGAARLVNETPDVPGHLGELARPEEQEKEDGHQNDLPWTDSETHVANITPRTAGYNASDALGPGFGWGPSVYTCPYENDWSAPFLLNHRGGR